MTVKGISNLRLGQRGNSGLFQTADIPKGTVGQCRSGADLGCAATAAQVVQMFDKAEAEYRELSDKKRILHNDKDKIHKVRICTCQSL